MEKLMVIQENGTLMFQLDWRKIKSFDIDDFAISNFMLLPYGDNFININVSRNSKIIDVLRTTTKKDKYPGDTGEMMFCGLMANSMIIRNWRKKNPHFLGITALTTGISADMFVEGDILEIEHSFGGHLEQIFASSGRFVK